MRIIQLLALAVILTGCAGSPIIMQNPRTQEIVQCNTAAASGIERDIGNNRCAEAYEKLGWTRVTPDEDKQ